MGESPLSSERDARDNAEWLRRAISAAQLGTWEWDVQSGKVLTQRIRELLARR